jgi:hypothetical protein
MHRRFAVTLPKRTFTAHDVIQKRKNGYTKENITVLKTSKVIPYKREKI